MSAKVFKKKYFDEIDLEMIEIFCRKNPACFCSFVNMLYKGSQK